MELEKRIQGLEESGKKELARRLIRGMIGSSKPDDIEIKHRKVTIEHSRYYGTHKITKETSGKRVKRRGEYTFTGVDDSLNITLKASNKRTINLVEKRLQAKSESSHKFNLFD